jgi:hypothetical protein
MSQLVDEFESWRVVAGQAAEDGDEVVEVGAYRIAFPDR